MVFSPTNSFARWQPLVLGAVVLRSRIALDLLFVIVLLTIVPDFILKVSDYILWSIIFQPQQYTICLPKAPGTMSFRQVLCCNILRPAEA